MTRSCYLISSPHKGFLVDLNCGEPIWSCSAHEALVRHHAWIDLVVAAAKLKVAQRCCPDEQLDLVVVSFEQQDGYWVPVSQQGVRSA